ncbi:hfsB [Asticcacaulis sp. AC402]|nr:hfsB [Asticcacaulis sp. AC402]
MFEFGHMVDLTKEMADLMSALGRPQTRAGRAFMFVSAFSGEGVSTVAREYARCEAAFAKRPVWLIDADLAQPSQMQAVTEDAGRFGPPGNLAGASPDGSAFFRLAPPARDAAGQDIPDHKYLVARPFLDNRLWVTRFRVRNLSPGQRPKLNDQSSYWTALRQHAQTIIVDVPALDRSAAALQLAPQMDGVILVLSEDEGDIQARIDLKSDIEQVGGNLMGFVYNRARSPRLARRPMGRFAAL